jgi:hypothetical protein
MNVRVEVVEVAFCEEGRRVAKSVPPHLVAGRAYQWEGVQERRELNVRLDKLSLPRAETATERQRVEHRSGYTSYTQDQCQSRRCPPLPSSRSSASPSCQTGAKTFSPLLLSGLSSLVYLHHGCNLSVALLVRHRDVARAKKSLFLSSIPVKLDCLLRLEPGVDQATKRRQYGHRTAAVVIGTRSASRRVTIVSAASEQHERAIGRMKPLHSPILMGTWEKSINCRGIAQVGVSRTKDNNARVRRVGAMETSNLSIGTVSKQTQLT